MNQDIDFSKIAMPPKFLEAVEAHQSLVERFGMDHPDTQRAMLLVMHHAPNEVIDIIAKGAAEFGIKPDACGYTEDGTAMYRIEDIAEKLGVSPEEAQAQLDEMLGEMESLGIAATDMVTDGSKIFLKQ